MKNARVSRRKEIIKIRAEINEKETKETIAKISKAKADYLKRYMHPYVPHSIYKSEEMETT